MDSDVFSVLSPFNAFEVNSILHHFPEGAVKKGQKRGLSKMHRTTSTTITKQTISSTTQEIRRCLSTYCPLLEVTELQTIGPQLCVLG